MSTGPAIGLPVPTSTDRRYNEQNVPAYVAAIQAAGGTPILLSLPSTPAAVREFALRCDGFVLPGSPADVDPARYGAARSERSADSDTHREFCDTTLLEHASATGKPLLAICYGLQMAAAWAGGSLVQDLAPVPVNHAAGPSVAVAHGIHVVAQSLLGSLLSLGEAPAVGQFRRLMVNSSHHQAISSVEGALTVVARCGEDGVVEAAEGRLGAAAFLGVQWHPERSVDTSSSSRALFSWLVAEAEDVSLSGAAL